MQPPSTVDGLNVVIESQSPVDQGLDCFPVSNIMTTIFLLPFSTTADDYVVIDTVCMQAGVVYNVTVQHLDVHNSQWMLDSVR